MISAPPPPPHRAPPRVVSAPVIARTPSTGPIVVRSAPTATPTTVNAPPPPNRVPSFVGATIHPQTAPLQQLPAAPLPSAATPSSSVANSQQQLDKESLRPQAPPVPTRTEMYQSIPMVQSGYFPSSERQSAASQRNRVMTPTRSDFLKPAATTVSWMAQEVPRFRYEPPPMLPQYFEVERVANTPVRERRRLSEAGDLPNDLARRSKDFDERSYRSYHSLPSDGEEYRDFPSSTTRRKVPIVSKEDFERRSTTPVRPHGSRASQRAVEEEEYEVGDRSSQRIRTTRDGIVLSPQQSQRHRRGHSGRKHSAHDDDEYVVATSQRQRHQSEQQPEIYDERVFERREQPQRQNRYVDAEVVHHNASRDDENEYQVGRKHRTAISVGVERPRRQSPENYVVGKTPKQVSRELLVEVERSQTTSPTNGRRLPTETEDEYRARRRAEREQRRMMAR